MTKKSCNNKYLGDLGLKYDPKSIIFCTPIPCLGVEKGDNLQEVLENLCEEREDSYISDVSINGNVLTFTGENEAFSGEIEIPTQCPCPVGTYTINSVCSGEVVDELEDENCLKFTVTANFTQETPTKIEVASLYDSDIGYGLGFRQTSNIYQEPFVDGDVITVFSCIINLQSQGTGDAKTYTFRLLDTHGNYSEPFTIPANEIEVCE